MSTAPSPQPERPSAFRRPRYEHAPITVYGVVCKRLFREWMPVLNEGELKLVSFLVAMTYGHEKKQGDYTLGQIMHGMDDKRNGGRICEGTGLSESTFYRAKKSLIGRGLITAKTHGSAGWVFEVNSDWHPTGRNVVHEGNVATLKDGRPSKAPAKKPKVAATPNAEIPAYDPLDVASETVSSTVGDNQIDRHPNRDLFQVKTSPLHTEVVAQPPAARSLPSVEEERFTGEETYAGPHGPTFPVENPHSPKAPSFPETLPAVESRKHRKAAQDEAGGACVDQTATKGVVAANARQRPAMTESRTGKAERPVTGDTIERVWRAAWKDAQAAGELPPTCIPAKWSPRDKKAMVALAQNWHTMSDGKTFHDFIAYVVPNWRAILRSKLDWMSSPPPPTLPSPWFLSNRDFYNEMLEAFCDQETVKWIGTLKGTAREIERAQASGMTREAAIFHVAKGHVLEIDRERRDADARRANEKHAMADLTYAKMRREIERTEKYYGPLRREEKNHPENRQPRAVESFAPKANIDPDAPLVFKHADFSKWEK